MLRAITGKKAPNQQAASVNTMGRFETEFLTQREHLAGLSEINGKWVQKAMGKTPHRRIILDLDSSESPVHGAQEGSAYNGHFGSTCFHPLFCFNHWGDCEGELLRPGNVHSADRWKELLDPVVQRYESENIRNTFVAMRPSPNQRFMNTWRGTASCMPSGCLPTSSSMSRYDPC